MHHILEKTAKSVGIEDNESILVGLLFIPVTNQDAFISH